MSNHWTKADSSPQAPMYRAWLRRAEAAEIAQGLARKIAESCIEHGDPLPRALADIPEAAVELELLVPVSVP